VGRPHVGGIGFTSDRSFVVLAAVVVAACLVGVGALRRSALGRRLVAMNDSPAACATVGLNLRVTKLVVFALSSAMAGLAGAIYGGLTGTAIPANFGFLVSIVLFVAVTLQGATLLSSAVLGGAGLALAPVIGAHISALSNFTDLAFGIGIITIGRQPNGMTGLLAHQWRFLRARRTGSGPDSDRHVGAARTGGTDGVVAPTPPRGSEEVASLA